MTRFSIGLTLRAFAGHTPHQRGSTMGTVEYRIRSVYGEDRRYVVDPTQAALISALTGRKTLTARDVNTLGGLGFTLVQKEVE